MLSIGWTEMLIIAAVALIVVGPKDLPAMLRQLGRAAGTVRRMGDEFRRELNKVAALDDVKEIRNSITQPLAQSRAEIEREFNTLTKEGPKPSGVLKPADPKIESVYDEIKAATGMNEVAPPPGEAARASMAASVKSAVDERRKEEAEKKAAVEAENPPAKAKPVKSKAQPASTKAPSTKAPSTKAPSTKTPNPKSPGTKPAKPGTDGATKAAKPDALRAATPAAAPKSGAGTAAKKSPRATTPAKAAAADLPVEDKPAARKPARSRAAAAKKA